MDTKLDKKFHHDCANHYNVYQEVGLPNALRQPRAKRVQDRPKLLLDLLLLVRRAVAVNRSLDLDCLALRAANISPRCHGACPERSRRERSDVMPSPFAGEARVTSRSRGIPHRSTMLDTLRLPRLPNSAAPQRR